MDHNTDFAKLVSAMFHDTREWRDLDQQIRTMNKKLSQWRKARYEGATFRLTQRAAVEVWVAMQVCYGIVEKPGATLPAAPSQAASLQPASPDLVRVMGDGAVVTGAFDYAAHETVAAATGLGMGVVIEARAA
jgi:hypothetical protein